jgi:hypothetical protein
VGELRPFHVQQWIDSYECVCGLAKSVARTPTTHGQFNCGMFLRRCGVWPCWKRNSMPPYGARVSRRFSGPAKVY